jgi:hypothetical protein
VTATLRALPVLLLLAVSAACSSRAPAPSADAPQRNAPDLGGRTVMVLPAQFAPGGGSGGLEPVPGLDAEIAYWLADRGPRIQWVFPAAIDRALQRNPTLGIRPNALAVGAFHSMEVRNIGDPLFGDLRTLGALMDARYALLPTAAAYVSREGGERVEVSAALIDTRGGNVLWFGVVAGNTGPRGSAAVASAAEALARAVLQ